MIGNEPADVYNHAVELRGHYIDVHSKIGGAAHAFSDVSLTKNLL